MEKNFLTIKDEYVKRTKNICTISGGIFNELQEVDNEETFKNILERAIQLEEEIESLSDKIEIENLTISQQYMIRFACRVYGAQINEFMEISWKRVYKEIFGNEEE